MYTILLVEDETMELLALRYAIESVYSNTFQILEAMDGTTALSLCQEHHPEIMIVDINIPGISGLNLIQSVNELNLNSKILITTAYDKSNYIRKALEMGVIGYLLKPVNITELKSAIGRCVEKMQLNIQQDEQLRTLQQSIESVCSYAKEYLVKDILSNKAPQEALISAYEWPEDGKLQVCILCWFSEQEQDYNLFYEMCIKHFDQYFSMLFSPVDGRALLFLQSRAPKDLSALCVILHINAQSILSGLGHGKISCTGFCPTYDELCLAYKKMQSIIPAQSSTLALPSLPMNILGSSHKRVLLRQKMLQRIRGQQTASLIGMLKKIFLNPNACWPGIALLLDAIRRYDENINLCELLDFFFQDNPLNQLTKWFNNYYLAHPTDNLETISPQTRIESALALIGEKFNQDLTLTDIADEFGLSAPYFSNLFKQQTGKNFVTYLNEVRIQHAIMLMEQGETDMEKIAEQCGYYSKKYYFEAFKRVTGQSVTQYRCGEEQ